MRERLAVVHLRQSASSRRLALAEPLIGVSPVVVNRNSPLPSMARKAGDRFVRRAAQRHPVLDVVLRAIRRDDPLPGVEVELGSRRRAYLVETLAGQDQQLHRGTERIAELLGAFHTSPSSRSSSCALALPRLGVNGVFGRRSPDCRAAVAPSRHN